MEPYPSLLNYELWTDSEQGADIVSSHGYTMCGSRVTQQPWLESRKTWIWGRDGKRAIVGDGREVGKGEEG